VSFIAGGVAVFTRSNEAGPVALIGVGALLFMIAVTGFLPTRLKIGDNEANWHREVAESVERIDRTADEVGTVLDASGASLDALTGGRAPSADRDLGDAGAQVARLERDVQFVSSMAGIGAVPPEALLELARWHLAQQEWSEAAGHLERYVELVDANWEVYFSLGVANANRRRGDSSNRAALRAYDEAMTRLPDGQPIRLTPRLYSYRAAIKKRLGRLVEARADAQVARQLAESRYDRIDATLQPCLRRSHARQSGRSIASVE
jgi:tetratricopeptide (TPR) repeat protein